MRRIFYVSLLSAGIGLADDRPEPRQIKVKALPVVGVPVAPGNKCVIPLLPVTPPGKDFKIREVQPDLKKSAPMPEYKGLPVCPVAPGR